MKNILITGASSLGIDNRPYHIGLEILVKSMIKYANDLIDHVYIFDLGLKNEDKYRLKQYEKRISICHIPNNIINYFNSDIYDLKRFKYYCYRSYILGKIKWKSNCNLLWLDAGVCFIDNPIEIFDIIDKENIFVVEHDDCFTNESISNEVINYLSAKKYEIYNSMCFGGICGFKSGSIYELLFKQIYEVSCDRDLIKTLLDYENGRQQTILSVLVDRYNISKQNHRKYAEHLGIKTKKDQVVYIHRCYNTDYVMDYLK